MRTQVDWASVDIQGSEDWSDRAPWIQRVRGAIYRSQESCLWELWSCGTSSLWAACAVFVLKILAHRAYDDDLGVSDFMCRS